MDYLVNHKLSCWLVVGGTVYTGTSAIVKSCVSPYFCTTEFHVCVY